MSNTISSTMMKTAAPSTTQLDAREVGDEIRYLGVGRAKLVSLIENSLYKDGKRRTSKGLISKRSVTNQRYEMYTRSPRPTTFTVTAGTEIESSGVTLDSVNGLPLYFTLFNTSNNTQCRVEAISTLTVTGTSYGGTTFSCAAGDVLQLGAPAYPEGSTEATIINGTDDNNFNILQYGRWSVSISWVLEATKQLAGGNRLTREKMYLLWEALADIERTLMFGDYTGSYASKNTTTGQQTGYTGEFPTTKGLWELAANSKSFGGSFTIAKLQKEIPLALDSSVNDDDKFIAYCSNQFYARLLEQMNSAHINYGGEGELKQYGIKSKKLVTAGPDVEFVKHEAMNAAGRQNQLLIFAPSNVGYVHLKGHDMGPNPGIQTNATHGKQDEVYAYFGFETKDAGKSILTCSELF